jgi:hypothetical protein
MNRRVLFISHPQEECGVHQFGKQVFDAISLSKKYDLFYQDVTTPKDLKDAIERVKPDAMIVNWYSQTLAQISPNDYRSAKVPVIGIMHEVTDDVADKFDDSLFSTYVVHDSTIWTVNPRVHLFPRPLITYTNTKPLPKITTIGSFGFATPSKNFEGLVSYVNSKFDECIIKLHMPNSWFADRDGSSARRVANACKSLITKPGIKLEVSFDFKTINETIDFLASNTINAFFYYPSNGRGISSAVDLAMASGRPVALCKVDMFRHLFDVKPSIFVEDNDIKTIISNGTAPFEHLKQKWTANNLCSSYEQLLDSMINK